MWVASMSHHSCPCELHRCDRSLNKTYQYVGGMWMPPHCWWCKFGLISTSTVCKGLEHHTHKVSVVIVLHFIACRCYQSAVIPQLHYTIVCDVMLFLHVALSSFGAQSMHAVSVLHTHLQTSESLQNDCFVAPSSCDQIWVASSLLQFSLDH